MRNSVFLASVLALGLCASSAQQPDHHAAAVVDLTPVKPESVGFSSERLEYLHAVMQEAPWLYDDYCIEFLAKLGLWPGEPPQPVR